MIDSIEFDQCDNICYVCFSWLYILSYLIFIYYHKITVVIINSFLHDTAEKRSVALIKSAAKYKMAMQLINNTTMRFCGDIFVSNNAFVA